MHTPGMAGGEQTADQPKTPTETAPPPGGSARAPSKTTATKSTTPDTGSRRRRGHPKSAPPR
jgi:hypothetical protein